MQAPNPEDGPFVERSAENELDSWDETGNLTSLLAQGDPLGFDSTGVHGNGDGTSLDTWYEALSTDIDPLPKLQADNFILDLAPDPRAAEWFIPLDETLTEIPSTIADSITPASSYLPTPDLTECSTPASFSTSIGSRNPTARSTGSFDTENQRWHATLSRSRTADRYFLYGVLTTKIYCRPSLPLDVPQEGMSDSFLSLEPSKVLSRRNYGHASVANLRREAQETPLFLLFLRSFAE